VVVQVISQRIVSARLKQARKAVSTAAVILKTTQNAHLKQVIKVASRAGVILKMTVNAPLKLGVKVASTVTAAVAPDTAVDAKQRARRVLTGHL